MKKTSVCSKCGSSEIVGPKSFYGCSITLTFFQVAAVEAYFCLDCGHVELFVQDKNLEHAKNLRAKGKI